MTRHVADNRAPSNGGRVRNFVAVERSAGDEGTHPAARALQRRKQEHDDDLRLAHFLRIARGRTA